MAARKYFSATLFKMYIYLIYCFWVSNSQVVFLYFVLRSDPILFRAWVQTGLLRGDRVKTLLEQNSRRHVYAMCIPLWFCTGQQTDDYSHEMH